MKLYTTINEDLTIMMVVLAKSKKEALKLVREEYEINFNDNESFRFNIEDIEETLMTGDSEVIEVFY